MNELASRAFVPLVLGVGGILVLFQVVAHPGSRAGYIYLAALLGLEVLAVVLANYKQRFLPLLFFTFLGAGISIPFQGVFDIARWAVLAVGAVAGLVLYLRERSHAFGVFHLFALFAVVTALVSALASTYPQIALMKTASLWLIFLYGAAGARLAFRGREARVFSGLLWGCEIQVYVSAFCYGALNFPIYGNPNSLGAVMGVVCVPILLWGMFACRETKHHKRRTFALTLCFLLLLSSFARSAILAAMISSAVVCFCLGQYRTLLKGSAIILAGALLVATFRPLVKGGTSKGPIDTLISTFVYKGEREQSVFASRTSPWDQTVNTIKRNPWFGSGFGTSVTDFEVDQEQLSFRSSRGATREHGNSYLAILEWTGILGVIPFYVMVLLIIFHIGKVVLFVRHSRDPFLPALPIVGVLIAALFHVIFEDWMFAVGYYMCIFFWTLAFVLIDMTSMMHLPKRIVAPQPVVPSWHDGNRVLRPGQ